ncbi:uncharacterized protein UV8b_00663 [Ustilaginoidea virens]|uniref:Protein Zds1 C-terminal domain-containing protein n=1 Tax=Ustilaginoidea virens TaxID=1159556 RepID=A0A8E5HJI0_USTVR|nr:uncharacterized protein UV8b_00663 [Ustilaginoidea virens]QUC16422.1 hypothetical protein UV8b_00663 [Ustilaginoidea virens]
MHFPSPNRRSRHFEGGSLPPGSSTLSLRDVQADASGSQFPLTNIDNPNDIAQELSNLQALRRMSMDVGNNIDPDMPPMGFSAMPVIAPTGDDDENDPSRLLWVPARVHPELAPSEFKSFLEKRVQSIRRRSGESSLSTDSEPNRSDSDSLRRRKSMLCRQIDNSGGQGAIGYVDGAERLEGKRSSRGTLSPELSLDDLVKDPSRAVQKFAQEAQGVSSAGEEGNSDDMPILPMAPGMGLRRSTRTAYRKGGSLRAGDRAPFSKRMLQRNQGRSADTAVVPDRETPVGYSLSRVQSEPVTENYSRPTRSSRRQPSFTQEPSPALAGDNNALPVQEQLSIRTINATPAKLLKDSSLHDEDQGGQSNENSTTYPQRSTSQSSGPSAPEIASKIPEVIVAAPSVTQSSKNSASASSDYSVHKKSQEAQNLSKSQLPSSQQQSFNTSFSPSSTHSSGNASRTDNLTATPAFTQYDKKSEKKSRKERDDDSTNAPSKSGGAWKWLKGVTDDKDKKKEESRRAKAKALAEKTSDNARLDVIQSSIDRTTVKGRESLVLDRDNVDSKLLDEKKKDSHRKGESKREKDGSIFSSLFGGSKRKEEKEKANKKTQHLQVPEEPIYKPLRPDVDYHWTRFPLLEERAIYRMAHIKLANPRRPLLSQVLLSNFMYSYLAIVQAMHPQMNVPTSPQQKRLEEEARRKRQEQEYIDRQQMEEEGEDNSLEQYNFDYHRAAVQYAESGVDGQADYIDEAQIYEDEHRNDNHDGYDYDNDEGYSHSVKDYYQYQGNDSEHRHHDDDDMW